MCDLMGFNFNGQIQPKYSFENFRFRDSRNKHGWGLALYPDQSVQIFKEAITATKSPLSKFLVDYDQIHSSIFISHVRFASEGSTAFKNTHPFSFSLHGDSWSFAHNGTMNKSRLLSNHALDDSFKPIGDTDSELAFGIIMTFIKSHPINDQPLLFFRKLEQLLHNINESGRFNCIFSDGTRLYCYSDTGSYNGMSFIERSSPFGEVRFLNKPDNDNSFVNLDMVKKANVRGFIISTTVRTGNPTDENWTPFRGGELKVFSEGEMIYSNLLKDIFQLLRSSEHRVSLQTIHDQIDSTNDEIDKIIDYLVRKNYLRLDRRSRDLHLSPSAEYYTNSQILYE